MDNERDKKARRALSMTCFGTENAKIDKAAVSSQSDPMSKTL